MRISKKPSTLLPLCLLPLILAAPLAHAGAGDLIDSVTVTTGDGTDTLMLRLGVQSNWSARWFDSNGTHLGGYWDLSIGSWRANRYRNIVGDHQGLYDVGIDPVFRFERDDKKGFYAEASVGAHRLSRIYNNDRYRLSTYFEFGDRIAIGYATDSRWDFSLGIEHFSNGGYSEPNSGVNFFETSARYHF